MYMYIRTIIQYMYVATYELIIILCGNMAARGSTDTYA